MKPASMALILLAALAIYATANFYLGKRMFLCLCALRPKTNAAAFAAIYAAAALTVALNFVTFPHAVNAPLRWIGACWTGFFFYAILLFLFADAAIAVGRLFKLIPSPTPQNIRLYAGLAAITLTAALIVWGIAAANNIKTTAYSVRLNGKSLPGGMKIALASDLHLGAAGSEKRLPKIISAINSQKPDLICIAGDIFNNNYNAISDPDRASALLKSLSATHGVYACLGNHDAGKNVEEMLEFLARSNIKPLNDEFDIVNGQFAVLGRLDPRPIGGFGGMRRTNISRMFERSDSGTTVTLTVAREAAEGQTRQLTIDGSMPVIVLDHNPKSIHEYGNEVDLVLSGHTHNGQLFPLNFLTRAVYAADYGHYRKEPGAPNLIVTSGAGTWGPPMRVGTRSEVVCVTVW
jgi:predicted MPP superfamily phosphohydrolase